LLNLFFIKNQAGQIDACDMDCRDPEVSCVWELNERIIADSFIDWRGGRNPQLRIPSGLRANRTLLSVAPTGKLDCNPGASFWSIGDPQRCVP
jgi:hypothetical protein